MFSERLISNLVINTSNIKHFGSCSMEHADDDVSCLAVVLSGQEFVAAQ